MSTNERLSPFSLSFVRYEWVFSAMCVCVCVCIYILKKEKEAHTLEERKENRMCVTSDFFLLASHLSLSNSLSFQVRDVEKAQSVA